MQQYSYKNSGVEWLGKIPKHWKVTKLKRVLSEQLKYGANESAELDDKDLPRYIRITDFGDDGKLKNHTFKSLPEEVAKLYPLTEGDVLFARSGATVGKTFQFKNYTGKACYAGYLIKASPSKWQLDSDFLYFYTKSLGYDEWKNLIFTQATIQNIGADKYQYLPIPLPPLPEQKALADYLDKACARIDRIIAIKEEQLRKIEGYYSSLRHKLITLGINNTDFISYDDDFLKKVPKHWKKQKLRYLLELKNGKLITNDELVDDGEIPVYGGNGIMGRTDKYNYDGELLILGRVGAKCGNVHYTNQKIWVSDNAISVRSIINYQYMYQLLTVIDLHRLASETAQPLLVGNNVKKLYVAIPPISEQMQIIEKIEAAHLKTQNLKKKVSLQIKTLQSYRKSLIHECVTGKKQVADVVVNSKQEINA